MQKLTSILAVLDETASPGMVLHKAVELARCFDAHLEVLVIEPLMDAKIVPQCDASGYADLRVRVVSRSGRSLESVILDVVDEQKTDLVIKARAGEHAVRRAALPGNDWRLSQHCPVPLMLVTSRPWSHALRLAAAVDVSDGDTLREARAVMQAAGFLALGCRGNLDILYTEREDRDETLRMERAVRLAQLVREFHVGCERLQMFDGNPEQRLPPLIASRQYDVLVLGAVTHHTGLVDSLWSLTSRLVDATPGDVVLVKSDRAQQREKLVAAGSVGEQVPHQGHQFV